MPHAFLARFFFVFFTLSSVFYFSPVLADTPSVVISEVGATASGNGEWIEIANTSDAPVDLTGWRFWEAGTNHGLTDIAGTGFSLPPHTYAVIVKNEAAFRIDHPSFTGILFSSSWGSLANSGEEIGLKTGPGDTTFIERFTYLGATAPHSVERVQLTVADYSNTNWVEHSTSDSAGQAYGNTTESPAPAPTPTPPPEPIEPTTATPQGNSTSLRLSEFLSDPNTGDHEWIELENTGAEPVDMSQIVLRDGASIIFTGTSTLQGQTFFVATLTSARLNNSGDTISLETQSGQVIDRITYGNWDDGTIGDNMPTPGKNKSLSRAGSVWVETDPTPGTTNTQPVTVAPTPNPTSPTSPPAASPIITTPQTVRAGDMIISEFVSDPTDGEVEFIELQNRSAASIDVTGWRIEDGGTTKTTLNGNVASMAFMVIEKPKGSLNNAGDLIILFDNSNQEIDRVAYGTWNDGNTSDNAATPTDPMSAARVNGKDTGYDKDDFVLTSIITKGTTNRFSTSSVTEKPTIIAGLTINEIYPNPPGSDEDEFIELKHTGKTQMRLAGWGLRDESLRLFPLPDQVIYPNAILVFPKKQTGISLNNTTDAVELVDPNGTVVDRVAYDHVPEGESYNRTLTNTWQWSTTITSGKENTIQEKNRVPVPVIETNIKGMVGIPHRFDASDTSDSEHDTLIFTWTFSDKTHQTGETATKIFTKPGTQIILLTVEDSAHNTATTSVEIRIENTNEATGGAPQILAEVVLEGTDVAVSGVLLSELTPNPVGSDEAEYIELYNTSDEIKHISGWSVKDASGKTYTLKNSTIPPRGYLLLARKDTGIALNNTTDSITLTNALGTEVDAVTYTGSTEGLAYAKTNQRVWAWTNTATPEKENIVSTISTTTKTTTAIKGKTVTAASGVPFATIHTLTKGKAVSVSGTVLALPGVWSSQMFTLLEETTGETLSIFLSNKQFPALEEGDTVRVQGTVSEAQGVKRVNAKSKTDIVVVGSGAIQPISLKSAGDKTLHLHHFIEMTGTVTEVTKRGFFLDANGDLEIVYRQALLATQPRVNVGDTVTVRGVITTQTDTVVLLPRNATDIVAVPTTNTATTTETIATSTTGIESSTVATGASLMTLLAAAFGRARIITMAGGLKRVVFNVVTKIKPPSV